MGSVSTRVLSPAIPMAATPVAPKTADARIPCWIYECVHHILDWRAGRSGKRNVQARCHGGRLTSGAGSDVPESVEGSLRLGAISRLSSHQVKGFSSSRTAVK